MNDRRSLLLERIDQRIAELGLSRERASLMAGMSRDGIRNLSREGGRIPRGANLASLARVLETTSSWLLGETDDASPAPAAPKEPDTGPPRMTPDQLARSEFEMSEARLVAVPFPLRAEMPMNVPIYGLAAGSAISTFEGFNFEGEIVDYARRPPALHQIKDAYALYITGHSMEPMHQSGDLRFVNPHKPYRRGDTVAIHVRPSEHAPLQCFIKIFIERRPDGIVARQLNPEAIMEFRAATIVAIHRVMTTAELFGI